MPKKCRGRKKVEKVMREYKGGKLRSSSGQKVTNRKQAIAIALNEAGLSRKNATSHKRKRRVSAAKRRRGR